LCSGGKPHVDHEAASGSLEAAKPFTQLLQNILLAPRVQSTEQLANSWSNEMRSSIYQSPLVLTVAIIALQSSARADDAPESISGVDVKLSVSRDRYDPFAPSEDIVKCTITNNTDRALEVPSAYDGESIKLSLSAQRWPWALYLHPVPPRDGTRPIGGGASEATQKLFAHPKAPLVHLEPGQSQTVFELKLDKILNPHAEQSADKTSGAPAWRWTWSAHGPPPQAPLVSDRDKFVPMAKLLVLATIDDKTLESNKVELKIAPHGAASVNRESAKSANEHH
jgi:hypothetical protein